MTSKRNLSVKKPLVRRIRRFMRRHIFNKRAAQGSVTIFLIIIMLPMLIFSCSVMDICKIFMARNSTNGALNLAMNSRLASYDDILKDMYGILASSANEDDLADKLTAYYKMTLESSTGSTLDKDGEKYVENLFSELFKSDMSGLDAAVSKSNGLLNVFENNSDSFSVTPLATSSVSNPQVMHKQIVEYMKYRGPVYLATGVLDKLTAFADVTNQANAANMQIEFENKMKETGDVFKKVYDTLNEFLNESKALETRNAFSRFYTDNKMHPDKMLIDDIYKLYMPCAYICSLFAEAIDNRQLKYVDVAKDAFDDSFDEDMGSSDNSIDDLKMCLSNSDEIKKAADDVKDRFANFGLTFISNNASLENSKRTVELLTKYFGKLFDGFTYTDYPDGMIVHNYLKAYNDVRIFINDAENQLKRNISDNRRKELEEKISEAKFLIGSAKGTVDKIEDALNIIKDFVEYNYNDILRQSFDSDINILSRFYNSVCKQTERLDFLLGNEGIDKIVKQLEEAAKKADECKTANNKIMVEDTKAAMMGVYEKNAAMVNEVAGKSSEGLEELKSILVSLKNVYSAQKQCIESMEFLCDLHPEYGVKNKVVNNGKVETDIDKYLKKFNDGHKGSSVKGWYSFEKFSSSYLDLGIESMLSISQSGYISPYFNFTPKSGVENLQKWDSKNDAIKDNSFYQLVKANSGGNSDKKTPEEEKAKGEANRREKDIKEMGKEYGSGSNSGNNPQKSGEEAIDDNKDQALKFIPKAYPTFMDYISDAKKVYEGNGEKDDLLNELDENSFSFNKSESKQDLTPDNNDIGNDLAQGAIDVLKGIGNFFNNLLTATRDNLYIAEYLTENFPCVTTCQGKESSAQMISGEMFYSGNKPTVVCAHSSLEYILYGDMNGDENEPAASVVKAGAVLFGVRFAFNLIYALTSADLAAQIEPIIAPLYAIPFAGPIARTVVLIGLALGESAIDVGLLMAGQKVALFKTTSTWICSPLGFVTNGGKALVETTIDKGIDFATSELIKAEDELANAISNGADNVKDAVDDYAGKMLDSMREEIENNVFNPIVTTIRSCITEFNLQKVLPAIEDVKKSLSKSVESAKENLGLNDASAKDDLVRTAEIEIFGFLEENIDKFAEKICNNLTSFAETANTAILGEVDALEKQIKEKFKDVLDKLDEQFKAGTGKLCDAVKKKVGSIANELKGKTKENGESLKIVLKSKINEDVRGVKPSSKVDLSKDTGKKVDLSKDSGKKVDLSKGDSSGGLVETKKTVDKTLCVSYEDYMYVFTVLGLCFNENDMLMRASQLMNANIELRIDGNTRTQRPQNAYNSGVTYDINKAYTLFKGEAGSKTRTMFLGTTWNRENQQWIFPFSNVYKYKATTYVGY